MPQDLAGRTFGDLYVVPRDEGSDQVVHAGREIVGHRHAVTGSATREYICSRPYGPELK
jgi:hypothetical protein